MTDPGGPFLVAVEVSGQVGTKLCDTWDDVAEAMRTVVAFMPTWDKATIVRADTLRPESEADLG